MKEKVGIALAIVFIACAMVCGLFLANMGYAKEQSTTITTKNTTKESVIYGDDYAFIASEVSESTSNQLNLNLYQEITEKTGTIVYNVMLVEFSDITLESANINFVDLENTYDQVSDYYSTLSNGKLSMKFNFYRSHLDCISSSYSSISYADIDCREQQINYFNQAKENAYCIKQNSTQLANCTIFQYLASDVILPQTMGWPHVSGYSDFCIVSFSHKVSGITIAHELGHTLNLSDLYTQDEYSDQDFVPHELMSYNKDFTITTNAYHREKLGWIDESSADDNEVTGVEVLNKNGRYTLYFPMEQNKTVAYKFSSPYNDGNYFYIEARNDSYCGFSELVVNRVNTEKEFRAENLTATCKNDCFIATIASIMEPMSTSCISYEGRIEAEKCIYTSSGIKLKISIGNVTFSDNSVSFDFAFLPTLDYVSTVSVIDPLTDTAVTDAIVLLNNKNIGTTNNLGQISYQFVENDQITIIKNGYSVDYTMPNMSYSTTDITTIFFSYQMNSYSAKFNAYTQDKAPTSNLVNYFYNQKTLKFYPNVTVKYQNNVVFTGELLDGQEFNICDGTTISIWGDTCVSKLFTFDESRLALIADDGEIIEPYSNANNHLAFDIWTEGITTIYELKYTYKDNPNKFATLTQVYARNANTNQWDKLTLAGSTSSNMQTFIVLGSAYNLIQFEIQNYWEYKAVTPFKISPTCKTYSAVLDQNPVFTGFDWFVNLFN